MQKAGYGNPLEAKRTLARSLLRKRIGAPARDVAAEPISSDGAGSPKKTSLLGDATAKFEAQRAEMMQFVSASPYFRPHLSTNAEVIELEEGPAVNFSGYNYLGLAGEPEVRRAAQDAIEQYGTSCSASRVASGETPLHAALEREIADFLGQEDALVFNSGFGTNAATVAALVGPKDGILHDSLMHASGLAGARLSGAARKAFHHNDLDHLEALLEQNRALADKMLIIVEGVYSMDGDVPDLDRLVRLASDHAASIMVDEAHSLGVLGATGRGLAEHCGVGGDAVDVWMGTLSKSLASCGGYIAGSRDLIEYLKYNADAFVYSCGLSPADTGAALAALRMLKREPERVATLQSNASLFRERAVARGLEIGDSDSSAVVPIIVGSSERALRLAERLNRQGVNVQPVFYPVVEENKARLRFFISYRHQPEQIIDAVDAIGAGLSALSEATA